MKNAQGTTITFATGFLAEILSFNPPRATRRAIDTTHLGTTTARTKTPGDLAEYTEMRVRMAYDPGVTPPIDSAAELVTITYPDGEVESFTGFMTDYGGEATVDDRMEADCTIVPAGAVTHYEES